MKQLPAPSTYRVTLTDRDDSGELKTELIVAHDFDVIAPGLVIFSVFEYQPSISTPGWAKVRTLNQHEWADISRIAGPAANATMDTLIS